MKKFTLLFAIIVLMMSSSVFAQKTWTGATSTAWNTSTNWSPSGVPATGDNVTIPSAPANQPVISGTTGVCKNLTINAGASLGISATTLNNASLTASGNATISGALTIGGQVTKTGKLTVVNITWASGSSMSGFLGGSIDVSGNWEFSSGSAISMGFSSVNFTGTSSTEIISKSSNSSFSNVTINKTGPATLSISATSTSTLRFGGSVTISAGATLLGPANITTIFLGNLNNSGHFSFNNGTTSFEKSSGTQTIQVNSSDFFNNMTINSGGTVTINNMLTIMDNLIIQSGVFDPLGNTVVVFGDWGNAAGPAGFVEGTGRVIFSGGNYHQYCSNETFNILEVHKAIGGSFRVNGAIVTCSQYDWTAGSIDVLGNGAFTALDLADDGIRGNYYVNTGCTINLYQDNYQYVDLGGNLTFTSGGTINVHGGSGFSQWPNYANASITMNGGTLDFVDNGISINNSGTFTFTTNISGGTIRTSKGFYCERADYNPTGGTIQLYGSTDSQLSFMAGTIRSLYINKNTDNTVTLGANTAVNGLCVISTGKLYAVNKVITPSNDVTIYSGGILHLGMAAQLKMAGAKSIHIENGGTLKTEGTPADNAVITRNTTGYYFIYVKNGGTLSANNTYFSYLNYIQFQSGSTLEPANAFYRCTFTNNSANPIGGVVYFNNNQEVSVYQAHFTALNSGYNVYKSNDAGHIVFKDATGAFAGATYEYDPYNRIDWVASTPGLWIGLTSSDWFTNTNWDDSEVPVETTNVIIPSGTLYSPVIDDVNPSGSYWARCNDLVLQSDLSLEAGAGLTVNGDFDSDDGQFTQDFSAYLTFEGSENASWIDYSGDDIYTDVTIEKSTGYIGIDAYGNFHCRTIRVQEGWFNVHQTLDVSDAGGVALFIEDGGELQSEIPASEINVAGSIHLFSGGSVQSQGSISCGKDYIAETGSHFVCYEKFEMNGTGTQYLEVLNGEDNAIRLHINKPAGTCYIKSANLYVENMNIENGTLSCNNGPTPTSTYNIYVLDDWNNLVGPSGFEESTGRVIFLGDFWNQSCSEETFNILEINQPVGAALEINGGNVVCAKYDWTAGTVKVLSGSFTANDLLDNAIKGSFICEEGGTINLTNSGSGTFVDLAGELHNYGGTINISGTLCYWPYNGDALVEMTGGIIDIKTCGLYINNNAWSLTDYITGGKIRTAYGFSGNRADFQPPAGEFEFYGSLNANISQTNGCTLRNVIINKSTGKGEDSDPSGPIFDERSGEMLTDGGRSNAIYLISDFVISKDLYINSGSFILNGYLADIYNNCHVYGTLIMTNASDKLDIGSVGGQNLTFYEGSTGNLSAGEVYPYSMIITHAGSSFSASVNNTIFFQGFASECGFENYDPNTIYGNVVLNKPNIFPVYISENSTEPIIISGNLTINPENTLKTNNKELHVQGQIIDFPTSTLIVHSDSDEKSTKEATDNSSFTNGTTDNGTKGGNLIIDNDYTLNGTLDVGDGNVLLHGHLVTNSTSSINISGGSFTSDEPVHSGFEIINGNLTMDNGLIEMTNTGFMFGLTATTNISGGTIKIGGSIRVDYSGTFQPTGGTLEFTGNITNKYVQLNLDNYAQNIVINKPGTEFKIINDLTIKDDLTIQAGILNPQNNKIYIRGDWNNLVGPDGFIEGTGRVVFNHKGDDNQHCSSEIFNIFEIDKGYSGLSTEPGTSISCQVFDWTSGGFKLYYSSFYAADLIDNGVYGDFDVRASTVELHQDAAQGVDFIGNIFIYDSEFKVYGGNNQSNWGTNGNANLKMYGGILDFVDQGINIEEVAPYTFTSYYEDGGVIRTQKSFMMNSPHAIWTVELYGNHNGMVAIDNGASVIHLKISKPQLPVFTNLLSSKIVRGLIIESGTTIVEAGNTVQCGYMNVNNGGDFRMASANLELSYTNIVVDSGGYFYTEGNEAAKSKITTVDPDESYHISILPGAFLLANNTIFENLDYPGIDISMGATVMPYQPFKNCEFITGVNAYNVYTLLVNNDQDLVIENAVFSFLGSYDDHNVSKWYDAGSVVMVNASGAYAGPALEHDQYNRIHWTGQLDSQTITIPAGWSGLSSFLQPAPVNQIENIIDPILPDFTILLNNSGMYYPAASTNTIGTWNSQDAFKVKMENEATLILDGGWELNKTFNMDAGWNLMPVIFNDWWDVPFAAQQLGGNLVIIKEVAGSKVYWPEYGIQTLYWLVPGKAYYVLLNSAGSVTFPENDVKAGVSQIPGKPNTESPWGKIQNTGNSHLIAIPSELLAGFSKGEVIGVFTPEGYCAGFETIADISQSLAITAYADDPTTNEKEGFIEEEAFIIKIVNPETGKEYKTQPQFDEQMPQTGYFSDNGVSALKSLNITGIGEINNDQIKIAVSPNPSNGIFNIELINDNQDAKWQIFNMHGSMVLSGVETGNFSIDLSSYPGGIYNLKIAHGGLQIVKKLVLR